MKQFVLVCSEESVAILNSVLTNVIQFVEVTGMGVPGHEHLQVLVSPVAPSQQETEVA